ncbi:MAG: MarP family serine protease [Acidimicrobiales bacterium]|nr:MarP family serine protease [Acidimicrobiales bacterium]
MNVLDVVILLVVVSAGIGGYRLGFLTRITSWVGLGLGLLLGARLLPPLLRAMPDAGQAELFFVAAGVLVGSGLVGQALGLLVGSRIQQELPGPGARHTDRVAGGAAAVVGVLLAVWLLLPAMAAVPEWPARQARTSVIARALHDALPEPPDTLQALRRLVGADQFPQVLSGLQAAPDLGPPPASSGLGVELAGRVAESTVKVEGDACRRVQQGSGFAVGSDLVMTNAHVVAGEDDTTVLTLDGRRVAGTVVAFDPERDVAVLSVPGLDEQPLGLADAQIGDRGAVFGHPGGGDLRLAPYEIARQLRAVGKDLYDRRTTTRDVYFLAAALRPGDSGAPLIDPSGQVVGMAFAIAPDRSDVAYALTVSELQAVLDGPLDGPVDTGPCLA